MAYARAALPLIACLAGLAALPPTAAAAAGLCEYDPETHVLSVDSEATTAYDPPTVVRAGDLVSVRTWSGPVDCAGPDATVTNTDLIDIRARGGEEVAIDLRGGRLAPGFSPEPGGVPEIEIEVNRGHRYDAGHLVLHGSSSVDKIRAGTASELSHINLNPDEADPDSDIVVDGQRLGLLELSLYGGADVIDARGGAGTGAGFASRLEVRLGSGDDKAYGGAGPSVLVGDGGHDTLHAGYSLAWYWSNDGQELAGGAGDDTLVAGKDDDGLAPGAGNDILSGTDAGGHDSLSAGWATQGVRFDLEASGPQDTGEGLDTLPGGFEAVYGTNGPDVLRGTSQPEALYGYSGDDVLEGRGGDDRLVGGWSGTDTDTADYGSAPAPVTVSLRKTGAQPTGGAGADELIGIDNIGGSAFADVLTGTSGINRIEGRGGADLVDGGLGSDVLDGGDGGGDTVTYAGRTAAVAVRLDDLQNDGSDPDGDGFSEPGEEADHVLGFENATGGAGPDRLFSASSAVNILAGRGGADFLDARDGSAARDVLNCSTGEDTYRRDATDTKQYCETELAR